MEAAASPVMQLLSNWHRVSGEIAQHFPMIASMMQKVASETQQALLILAREASQDQQGQGSQPSATPQTAQPQGYQPSGF